MQAADPQGPHFFCCSYFSRRQTARNQENANDVKLGELSTGAIPASSGQHVGNLEYFCLDLDVKMGYLGRMFRSIVFFALRLSLVATTVAFAWRLVEPKTQLMRIVRAALLVLSLLAVLAVVKVTGP